MLLKSLDLLNFRQFMGEQHIDFAQDRDKNVTIIFGDNGTGKTTLAQAFKWCMYGEVDFSDKRLLNRTIENQMRIGQVEKVRVTLILVHNGIEYTLSRTQAYKLTNTRVNADASSLTVRYTKNGNSAFEKGIQADNIVREILAKELSRYFFFDGERIENMSKEIKQGKSKEFAEAVKSLLGLSAFSKAISLLGPSGSRTVMGQYNAAFEDQSDLRLAQTAKEIRQLDSKVEECQRIIENDETQLIKLRARCEELTAELATLQESETLAQRRKILGQKRANVAEILGKSYVSLFNAFSKDGRDFFAQPLISGRVNELTSAGELDMGVPAITDKTIDFLINRNKCICGAEIHAGNEAFRHLSELLKYIPPRSLGTSIYQFSNESSEHDKVGKAFLNSFSVQMSQIRTFEGEIQDYDNEISDIEKKIRGMKQAGPLQQELDEKKKHIEAIDQHRISAIEESARAVEKKGRLETEREKLSLQDDKNQMISVYLAYAQAMLTDLRDVYEKRENQLRKELQETINTIYKDIYNGGITLEIDKNYQVRTIVTAKNILSDDTETSTAQSISVIFAFIAGVIQMARKAQNGKKDEELIAEPYPLVMDAPLSAFDTTRIKNVCEVLPGIAEQIIIFIKDTDGDIAMKYMGHRIGKQYSFVKESEFETTLEKGAAK